VGIVDLRGCAKPFGRAAAILDPEEASEMNGATSLVHTLLASGVDTCFANPGTSEMHFVAALDRVPGMHCVLGLQENVVTGMADGYWRIAGKPACTLLHCGPGLANGLGNLHNARRARSGIVNLVGDQATYHRPFDAPLTADTDGLARTVSHWVRTCTRAADLGRDAAEAARAARTHPGQVATLIAPSDVSWDEGGVVAPPLEPPVPPAVDGHAVDDCARVLRSREDVLILLADRGVSAQGQVLAWRVARATGASLLADFVNAKVARGRGRLQIERVPYVMEQAIAALKPFRHIVLVGAKPPVGFFAYPGMPSIQYSPQAELHVLSRPEQDPVQALQALVDALGAPEAPLPDAGARPEAARGRPTPEGLAQTVAALMPEHAIVSDESVSFGRGFYRHSHAAPPHDWLHLAGGAIGDGLPVATGAAIGAGRQRRVIGLQADGSAMYSLQSLWTQAREGLPVTTILLDNGTYNILLNEYRNVGAVPGPTALGMLDLGRPALDWVALARGLGVEAARADSLETCADLMRASFARTGPFLIDLAI
jgi:acetolactate synthase-1/2/3 large subunit